MNQLKLQEVEEYLNKQYAKNKKWPSCPISRTWMHCKIPTNPKKLLQKQKEWKKIMKQFGSVEIPQEAFMAVLDSGK